MTKSATNFSSYRILVVEDSEPIRGMIRSYLESLGFRFISIVEDGAQALADIQKQAQAGVAYDVVLSDLNMPNMSGMELLKALRASPDFHSVPFIIMTSNSDTQDIVEALNEGASNYIIKPVAIRVLSEKLAHILQSPIPKADAPAAAADENVVPTEERIVPPSGYVDTALKRLFDVDTRTMSPENIEKLVSTLVDEYAFIKNAIHSLADFFIIVNELFHIVKVNKYTCEFLKVQEHQAIGKKIDEIFEIPEGLLSDHLREIRLGVPLQLRAYTYGTGGQRFPVVLTATIVHGMSEGLHGIVIYARDVTREEQMLAQIADLERWRSLGEMAAGIAHEVNNPLAIIKGYAELLDKMLKKPEIDRKYFNETVRKVIEVSERIANIVKGMLAFSRDGSKDEIRKVEVSSVVAETINFCRERFKKSGVEIRIKNSLPAGSEMMCRPLEISQVLMNLMINAFDVVKVDSDKKNHWMEIEVIVSQDKVEFAVLNPGPVIPDHIAKKIFQPFYTTKDAEKGTGLGLSICKRIVESHGGVIYLDRTSPMTRFVFSLSHSTPKSASSAA